MFPCAPASPLGGLFASHVDSIKFEFFVDRNTSIIVMCFSNRAQSTVIRFAWFSSALCAGSWPFFEFLTFWILSDPNQVNLSKKRKNGQNKIVAKSSSSPGISEFPTLSPPSAAGESRLIQQSTAGGHRDSPQSCAQLFRRQRRRRKTPLLQRRTAFSYSRALASRLYYSILMFAVWNAVVRALLSPTTSSWLLRPDRPPDFGPSSAYAN
ncbi:hypothetical protein L596_008250 [Steinernema carpocapsae]|uniref:Uncharacterized protein n=1 Tax=Steinernema carpocapsae TaxID=34508 RepID=A0A4U5PC64_STECR|nr:hypothetical protein L596_008250 [Steinernema carpocapsae]